MSSNTDFIKVPPPMFKYKGGDVIHDDNEKILKADDERRSPTLSKQQVKALESKLNEINAELGRINADERVERYNTAKQMLGKLRLQYGDLKQEWRKLKTRYENTDAPDELKAIANQAKRLQGQKQDMQASIRKAKNTLRVERANLRTAGDVRKMMQQRKRVQQRLQSHYTAVQEKHKEKRLTKEMAQEAGLVSQQVTRTLARLGFKEKITRGKRTITKVVEFDQAVVTPDQIQLKIKASRQGLAGGTIDLLPNGVYASDILNRKVMNDLSMTLEREVWSPQVDEDVSYATGGWIIIERMGLYEGIPRKVTYRQIMARYETADHERIPVPAGLRRGRRINWTYLDSHASTHMMFTGITGSGKTNAIQACISAVVETQSPRDVLFAFIDLKNQGDFNELADAPHILRINDKPIITQIPDVVDLLKAVRGEMHWRQSRIGAIAKNINSYNSRVPDEEKLPRIVVLFDEYANTRRGRFADEAEIIDDIATEITQLGRASGIHLWLGIQQPRASNMPQALRDNFTTLFVGHQANIGAGQSVTGNRTSLKLPDIPGRMLAYAGWKSYEVQMPLVYEDDINDAVKTANAAYAELEPYQIHYNEEDVTEDPLTADDIVIEAAFNVFDGALKKRAIWEHLKPRFSQNEVFTIIDDFIDTGTVEYDGGLYVPEKQPGNWYLLVKVDSRAVSSPDS